MTNTERRQKVRLQPKALTFVAVRPEFARLGRLIDISMDGACFQYMTHGDQVGDTESIDVDIFLNNNGLYLQNVPCSMIYDKVIEGGMTLPNIMENRRCGLQFRRLTQEHIAQMDLYLRDYTAGET